MRATSSPYQIEFIAAQVVIVGMKVVLVMAVQSDWLDVHTCSNSVETKENLYGIINQQLFCCGSQ